MVMIGRKRGQPPFAQCCLLECVMEKEMTSPRADHQREGSHITGS